MHYGRKNPLPYAQKFPQGMGSETLCEACNGQTGATYGHPFANFVTQLRVFADHYTACASTDAVVQLPIAMKPLPVLKQMLVGSLATASRSPIDAFRDLRHFALNPRARHLPSKFRVRAYLNPVRAGWKITQNRLSGDYATLDVSGRGGFTFTIAEIAFPPIGWTLTAADTGRDIDREQNLTDISFFGHYAPEQAVTLFLTLPIRQPVGPGTYYGDE